MHFAAPIPLWLAALVAAAIGAVAVLAYRRPLTPLSAGQRGVLIALRALSLLALLLIIWRPIILLPAQGDAVVPVLIDVSRSMRVADADGLTRLARAVRALNTEILPGLSGRFKPELYAVGDALTPVAAAAIGDLQPIARRSDLAAALTAVREKYRGRNLPGVVLLSDGGDTTQPDAHATPPGGPSVFAIGVGRADGLRDREVLGLTAGDPRVDQASVDVQASVVSHGSGREPYDLHVRANGQLVETRRVTPAADGSPVSATFTVSPDPLTPTVFTVDVDAGGNDTIAENNSRGLIVPPAGRKRRILVLEGAPGFEHSFMVRALSEDPGLDLDSIVRKGKNEIGRDTFLVQAGGARAASLTEGFPSRREELFAYDAVIIANVEGDFFTGPQLTQLADFVGARGGGLLVLGGRSFSQRGLIGTPLEDVLPVELNDRRGGLPRSALDDAEGGAAQNVLTLTAEGLQHPVMRVGSTADETRTRWAALPPLAATAPLGGPRPGASVLGVVAASTGLYPAVAVQRFGRGRSMVFGGEAAWRWRMMRPATDRTFEFFWRQSARWLAGPAPDPVSITVPDLVEPGDSLAIAIDARDAVFSPVPDARVDATLTLPGGTVRALTLRRESSADGGLTAAARPDQPGLYRVHAEAHRGATPLGTADRWFYVGGSDREFADPRLNEGVLRRIARASAGRYVPVGDGSRVVSWLDAVVPQNAAPEQRDVWHQPWVDALMIAGLAAEWILRRRWGLR